MAKIHSDESQAKAEWYNASHPKYDASNPTHRQMILDFETTLDGYKSPWAWELYCIEKKYLLDALIFDKQMVNGRVVKAVDTITAQINGNLLVQLEDDRNKKWAVQILKERRGYAKTKTHQDWLASFGETKCVNTIDSENRCLMCYPITFTEISAPLRKISVQRQEDMKVDESLMKASEDASSGQNSSGACIEDVPVINDPKPLPIDQDIMPF